MLTTRSEPAEVTPIGIPRPGEKEMTYGQFYANYQQEIDVLDVYFRDGQEVPIIYQIPAETPLVGFSRYGGWFDVMLDCNEKKEVVKK